MRYADLDSVIDLPPEEMENIYGGVETVEWVLPLVALILSIPVPASDMLTTVAGPNSSGRLPLSPVSDPTTVAY